MRWRIVVPAIATGALVLVAVSRRPSAVNARSVAAVAPTVVDTLAFVAAARAGTQRYADRQRAIDDGFTRVGVAFPAMGEHWVSFARLLENRFDPARPAVLIYVDARGRPRLSGVAYSRLVAAHDTLPSFPSSKAWHQHNGSVDDESLPLTHAHAPRGPAAAGGEQDTRLFVLHAWVWDANPRGIFSTDNWRLPLVRLDLPSSSPAPALTAGALHALALGQDDYGYYAMLIRAAAHRDTSVVIDSLTARHGWRSAQVAARARAAAIAPDSPSLDAIWRSLWTDLRAALPAERAALDRLRRALDETTPPSRAR